MAKVMVSLPDELLASIDAEAKRRGTTRSGLLRTFADQAMRQRAAVRAERIERAVEGHVGTHGGNSVEDLKRLRPR